MGNPFDLVAACSIRSFAGFAQNAESLGTKAFQGSFCWQGKKDSNPQQRFWRPTCYHYTIALWPATEVIILKDAGFVKGVM